MKHTQRLKLLLLFGAGLLAALVTLRFWQKVTAPGLSVPALQGLGLELAVQLLAIGGAANLAGALIALREQERAAALLASLEASDRVFRLAARAAGAMVFSLRREGLVSPQTREELQATDAALLPEGFRNWVESVPCPEGEIVTALFPAPDGGPELEACVLVPEGAPEERVGCILPARSPAGAEELMI